MMLVMHISNGVWGKLETRKRETLQHALEVSKDVVFALCLFGPSNLSTY